MKLMIDDDDFDAQVLLSLQLAILLINPSLRTATIICMHVYVVYTLIQQTIYGLMGRQS